MRCLVVADLHYSLQQYDWVMEVADTFDVLIIAGDHLDLSSLVDARAQSIVIRKYIDRLSQKTKLIVCSGNHDLDHRNDSGEKVTRWIRDLRNRGVATDGESFVFEGTLFTVCPWWDGPMVREAIGRQLAADAERRAERWIWVHHAPPDQSPTSWGGSRYFGDVELVEWIGRYQPDVVFSGHVHQSPFVKDGSWVDRVGKTWIFNPGHQFGPPPAHIILDTEREIAYWFSAAGQQFVRLGLPLQRPISKLAEMPDWLTFAGRAAGPNPA